MSAEAQAAHRQDPQTQGGDTVTQSLSWPLGGGKGQFKEPVRPREVGASPHPLQAGSREAVWKRTENVAVVSEGTSSRSPALAARALR